MPLYLDLLYTMSITHRYVRVILIMTALTSSLSCVQALETNLHVRVEVFEYGCTYARVAGYNLV